MAFKFLAALLFSGTAMAQLRTTDFQQSLNASAPRNYVINSGAEKNDLNVTDAGGIVSRGTSAPLEGVGSFTIDAASSTQKAIFTASDLQSGLLGQTCEATFNYLGDGTLYKAYATLAGTTVSSEVTLLNSGTNSQPVSVTFPCGASTTDDPAVVIEATGNGASIKVDSVYLGKALSLGTVAQAQFIGSIKWVNTASCEWSRTNAAYAAQANDTDCDDNARVLTGLATDVSVGLRPAIGFPYRGAGRYLAVASGAFGKNSVNSVANFRFSDGTNAWDNDNAVGLNTTQTVRQPLIEGSFSYGSTAPPSATITLDIQSAADGGGAAQISPAGIGAFTISIYYYPDQPQTVLRANVTNVAVEASGTPTGSLTAASATIWGTEARDTTASYNSTTGEFTAPLSGDYCWNAGVSVGGTEALDNIVSLTPYVAGVALTRFEGSTRVAAAAVSSTFAQSNACTYLTNGQVLTFRTNTSITGPAFAAGSANYIAVWNASGGIPKPFIPSSVFAGRAAVVKIGSAELSCAAASTITSNPDAMINTIGNRSSADCAVTFVAGFFSSAPICVISPTVASKIVGYTTMTSSGFTYKSSDDDAGAASDTTASLICIGN